MKPYEESLESYFQQNPPPSIAEAPAKIEEQTGIKRSPTQVRAFLQRLGLKRPKVGTVPGHALDPDKQAEQEEFKTKDLEPRLEESKQGKRYFFL